MEDNMVIRLDGRDYVTGAAAWFAFFAALDRRRGVETPLHPSAAEQKRWDLRAKYGAAR